MKKCHFRGGIFGAKPKKSRLHFRYTIVLYCAYVLGTYEGCIFCNYARIVDLKKSGNNSMTLGPRGEEGGKSTNYPGEVFYPEPPPFNKRSWRHIHIWPLFQIAKIHPNPGRESHSLNRGLLVIFHRRTSMGFGSK